MNILHVTPSFYPATYWGGPIWSTKAICDGIAAQPDMDVRVLTTDAAGPRVAQRVAPASLAYPVHYARRIAGHSIAPSLVARLPRAVAWADVVHLTGVYSTPTLPVFQLCRALGRPLIWSPRGALQASAEWADAPKRRAKAAFEWLLQRNLPRKVVMHLTARSEAEASATRFPDVPARVIANAVPLPAKPDRAALGAEVRLLYLGRLHPKKGLDLLIAAMGALPAHFRLNICGTGDPAYVAGLQHRAAGLGGRITFGGHVEGAAKHRAFAGADLFVLPSYSENFGISVAEALAHGLPVLTTDATPWQRLHDHACGSAIRLGRDDLAAAIAVLSKGDLRAMGERGRAWMGRDFSQDRMVADFADLYRGLSPDAAGLVPA